MHVEVKFYTNDGRVLQEMLGNPLSEPLSWEAGPDGAMVEPGSYRITKWVLTCTIKPFTTAERDESV